MMGKQPTNADAVLAQIRSLRPRERSKVFEQLANDRDNKPVIQLLETCHSCFEVINDLWEICEQLAANVGMSISRWDLRDSEKLYDLRQATRRLQRTRGMTGCNLETLMHYTRLRGQGFKDAVALEKLTQLPSEQDKPYTMKYRETKDPECLRQYVKRLRRTARRSQHFFTAI
jgi:hypothetical protein